MVRVCAVVAGAQAEYVHWFDVGANPSGLEINALLAVVDPLVQRPARLASK